MARKKAAQQIIHESTEIPSSEVIPHEVKSGEKKWVDVANPFRHTDAYWPDGYKITMLERSWTKEGQKQSAILIKFGDGSKESSPKAFEQIKETLREHGYRWDADEKAWARWLKSGKEQEGRIHNAKLRDESKVLFDVIVSMEESVRGELPGRSQQGQEIPF